MSLLAFTPSASVTLAVTTTQNQGIIPGTGHYLRLVNGGVGNAWVAFYELGAVPPNLVAGSALLILPGAIEVFSVASDTTRIAVIGDAAGTSLNISRGEGQ